MLFLPCQPRSPRIPILDLQSHHSHHLHTRPLINGWVKGIINWILQLNPQVDDIEDVWDQFLDGFRDQFQDMQKGKQVRAGPVHTLVHSFHPLCAYPSFSCSCYNILSPLLRSHCTHMASYFCCSSWSWPHIWQMGTLSTSTTQAIPRRNRAPDTIHQTDLPLIPSQQRLPCIPPSNLSHKHRRWQWWLPTWCWPHQQHPSHPGSQPLTGWLPTSDALHSHEHRQHISTWVSRTWPCPSMAWVLARDPIQQTAVLVGPHKRFHHPPSSTPCCHQDQLIVYQTTISTWPHHQACFWALTSWAAAHGHFGNSRNREILPHQFHPTDLCTARTTAYVQSHCTYWHCCRQHLRVHNLLTVVAFKREHNRLLFKLPPTLTARHLPSHHWRILFLKHSCLWFPWPSAPKDLPLPRRPTFQGCQHCPLWWPSTTRACLWTTCLRCSRLQHSSTNTLPPVSHCHWTGPTFSADRYRCNTGSLLSASQSCSGLLSTWRRLDLATKSPFMHTFPEWECNFQHKQAHSLYEQCTQKDQPQTSQRTGPDYEHCWIRWWSAWHLHWQHQGRHPRSDWTSTLCNQSWSDAHCKLVDGSQACQRIMQHCRRHNQTSWWPSHSYNHGELPMLLQSLSVPLLPFSCSHHSGESRESKRDASHFGMGSNNSQVTGHDPWPCHHQPRQQWICI